MRHAAIVFNLDLMKYCDEESLDVARLTEFTEKYRDTYFGEMVIDRLTLGVASLRMQPREVQVTN